MNFLFEPHKDFSCAVVALHKTNAYNCINYMFEYLFQRSLKTEYEYHMFTLRLCQLHFNGKLLL